jgi:hypothetical protein
LPTICILYTVHNFRLAFLHLVFPPTT